MKKIVVLISGSGSNLQSIIDACQHHQIDGQIAAVISNKSDAYGLIRAQEAGIPALVLAQKQSQTVKPTMQHSWILSNNTNLI